MSSFFTRLTSIALVLACLTQVSATAAPVKSELDEGIKLYQAKNYQAARLAFEKFIKANPSSWQAQYYMANTCLALGQWPQAKYCYQVCMHYCKDPGTQAQCQAGIDSIENFPRLRPLLQPLLPQALAQKLQLRQTTTMTTRRPT
ncbi:MAG: tetratricopeptide repeat protein [Candidatus Obscuribacter sp.]|nr:tetratricopeptide repeat protein [Candidatus Obscuribacter sp.]